MSCKNFEQSIYLYDELSASEKNVIDVHLQICPSCTEKFEEIKRAQLLIKQVAKEGIVPSNAARITSGIMSKISTERAIRVSIFGELFLSRARIALAGLSIILLVSFAVEFLQ